MALASMHDLGMNIVEDQNKSNGFYLILICYKFKIKIQFKARTKEVQTP